MAFQFLQGKVQTPLPVIPATKMLIFQFLQGKVQTQVGYQNYKEGKNNFNSYKVRYKHTKMVLDGIKEF